MHRVIFFIGVVLTAFMIEYGFAQQPSSIGTSITSDSAIVTGKSPLLNVRFGVGSTIGPNTLLLMGNAEIRPDTYFSFGPMLQVGVGAENYWLLVSTTLGGRFIIPRSFFRTFFQKGPGIELSLHSGLGVLYRDVDDFEFVNFVYQVGMNLDIFFAEHFSAGMGSNVNITSEPAEGSFGAVYACISMHY